MFDSTLLESLLPEQVRLAFARLHQCESVSLLRGLGYLVGEDWDAGQMQEAVAAFRREWQAFRRRDASAAAGLLARLPYYLPVHDPDAPLSTDETALLRDLAALEGGWALSCLPWGQEATLAGRVVRHRLVAWGYTAERWEDALLAFCKVVGVENTITAANLAGDIGALAKHCLGLLDGGGERAYGWVYCSVPEEQGSDRMLLAERGERFREALRGQIRPESWAVAEAVVLGRVGRGKESAELFRHLSAQLAEPLNALCLHLVQHRLWLDGMMEAAPREAFGKEAWEALDHLLGFRNTQSAKVAPDRDPLVVHVQDGIWALNVYHYFREVTEVQDHAADAETLDDLYSVYDAEPRLGRLGISKDDLPKFRTQLEERLDKYVEDGGGESGQGLGQGVLARLLRWLRARFDGIGKTLDRLVEFVHGGREGLLLALKWGWDMIGRAVEAIRQPPTIRTETEGWVITTVIGLSLEPVTTVPLGASAAAYAAHAEEVGYFLGQLQKLLRLVGNLIRWGVKLASGPVSWVEIGAQVMRMGREVAAGG